MVAKKRTRSQAGKLARDKGAAFERLVAGLLRPIFPEAKSARRLQARKGGKEAPDVEGTPFFVEAKHKAKVNWRAAYQQGLENTDGRPVVAFVRKNRQPIMVAMSATTACELSCGDSIMSDDRLARPVLMAVDDFIGCCFELASLAEGASY